MFCAMCCFFKHAPCAHRSNYNCIWYQHFSRSTALITEREKLEFESLPEFVREPRPARDTYVTKAAPVEEPNEPAIALPKSAELEALWPGVNHDVFHVGPKKGPSFYLSIGFAVGAVFSWIGVWAFSAVSHNMASAPAQSKEIVVAQGKPAGHQPAGTISG